MNGQNDRVYASRTRIAVSAHRRLTQNAKLLGTRIPAKSVHDLVRRRPMRDHLLGSLLDCIVVHLVSDQNPKSTGRAGNLDCIVLDGSFVFEEIVVKNRLNIFRIFDIFPIFGCCQSRVEFSQLSPTRLNLNVVISSRKD